MREVVSHRYRIIREIGRGGMSNVYLAADEVTGRYVALKALRPENADDDTFVERFKREAKAAARMKHENVVRTYGSDVDGDMHYIVMEYVDGITLKTLIRREHRMAPKDAVRIIMRVLAAVNHAHQNGIIHRDIKPQNILIREKDGCVKVTDFGISRLVDQRSLTNSSTALGSVHYMSPEQAKGERVDEKSDLYSVGIVLFEMLTGEVPFDASEAVAVALKQVNESPPSVQKINGSVSRGLDEVVSKALAKNPEDRYRTAEEMAIDLKTAMHHPEGGFIRGIKENTTKGKRSEGKRDSKTDANRGRYPHQREWVISLFALAVVIIVVIRLSNHLYRVEIPNVIGETAARAESVLRSYELVPDLQYTYDDFYNADWVVDQWPTAGTVGRRGDGVRLYISLGMEPLDLPDVTGKSVDEAVEELRSKGFNGDNIRYTYVFQSGVETDWVVGQMPGAGQVSPNSIITLTVNTQQVIVPPLNGLTCPQAEERLQSKGLRLGEVSTSYSMDAVPNTVIAQTVPSGTTVYKNTRIGVTISLQPPAVYYNQFTLTVPLTMTVRIVQISPTGQEKEIYNGMVEGNTELRLSLSSGEPGSHMLEVYYDGDLNARRAVILQ